MSGSGGDIFVYKYTGGIYLDTRGTGKGMCIKAIVETSLLEG